MNAGRLQLFVLPLVGIVGRYDSANVGYNESNLKQQTSQPDAFIKCPLSQYDFRQAENKFT